MSVNKFLKHVYVLPEDSANRQIATIFCQSLTLYSRQIQVMPVANGWKKVLELFEKNYLPLFSSNADMHVVLLIDFDAKPDQPAGERMFAIKGRLPEDCMKRVYVIGARKEPEDLKRAKLGSFQMIGKNLAKDCDANTDIIWSHELLRHNASELDRMKEDLRPILFQHL